VPTLYLFFGVPSIELHNLQMKLRPTSLRLWLSAIDPGLIRLLTAGRAALALLSIWLVLRTALIVFYGGGNPVIPLFGVQSGMIFSLFIIDLRPAERKVSLWLATLPLAGAILLASSLAGQAWINYVILLLLFFFSYFLRRYGTRAGELALVTTVGFYLGFLLHPKPDVYPFLVMCVLVSALVVYLWEFVIIPYDPVKYLYRSVRAFYHNVGRGVAAVRQTLEAGEGGSADIKTLPRYSKQVNRNRSVIEGLFAATVSPSLWSQSRLNELQEEMFKSERGLEVLIAATGKLSAQIDQVPVDVLEALQEGLAALEDQVWGAAAGKQQERLAEAGELLQVRIKSNLAENVGGEWVLSLLQMGLAARQLAQSVAHIQGIEINRDARVIEAKATKSIPPSQPASFNRPGKKGRLSLHPTSILGLQAVLATGLAMLAATLLRMDSPNLVFWTAFVVIAGSTGESLRRITMRVVGVIAGTALGVSLAVLLPNNLTLTVLVATVCLFFTIYILTISYAWMVFWLNVALMLIITSLGGRALELLVVRPISTLLGAAMAAFVVMFLLPIRVHNRFVAALAEFMRAVDQYVECYVASMVDSSVDGDLGDLALRIDASYKRLELTLPSVVYEYNPLSRSQSRLASQGTSLAVLKSYVTNLKEDVGAEPGSVTDANRADLMRSVQRRIHANAENLVQFLVQEPKEEKQNPADTPERNTAEVSLKKMEALEGGPVGAVRDRALVYLARINDSIVQIAEGIGAP
jgi:hypothetical protein